MARVSTTEVAEIINYDTTTFSDITPFITAANLVVTNKLTGSGLGSSLLKEIERWYAAHLLACADRRIKSEKIGDASVTYDGTTGKGLEHTPYGQQVMSLDTSGKMATLGKRAAAITAIDFAVED